MKNLKCRALDRNGDFVYGLLFYSHGTSEYKITHSDGWVPSYGNPDQGETNLYTDIKSETIGVCVGIKDIEGTDIYQGDVITLNHLFPNDEKVFYRVVWDEKRLSWGYRRSKWHKSDISPFNEFILKNCKVEGNIHQHKELIKK